MWTGNNVMILFIYLSIDLFIDVGHAENIGLWKEQEPSPA